MYYNKHFICTFYLLLCLFSFTSYYNESCWFLENWITWLEFTSHGHNLKRTNDEETLGPIPAFVWMPLDMHHPPIHRWWPSTQMEDWAFIVLGSDLSWHVNWTSGVSCAVWQHSTGGGSCESCRLWGGAFMDLIFPALTYIILFRLTYLHKI